MTYTISTTLDTGYDETVTAVRAALADQGFGVLTEIDLQVAMKEKLDADIEPQVILGACRPPLALAALEVEPSVGALLPGNLVVRRVEGRTVVEAADPQAMMAVAANPALAEVADDARRRIVAALDALSHQA